MKCCIKSCGAKHNKNLKISLHKLPTNETLKKLWLEYIGLENIDYGQKSKMVCSLHFEERYINRTLDNIRLHENAMPTIFNVQGKSIPHCSNISRDTNESHCLCPLPSPFPTAPDPLENVQARTEYRLKEKCSQQLKKIKRLHEKCRRQDKKIANFIEIIKKLRQKKYKKSEATIILEACAGSKKFLQKEVSKSIGLPLERKYSVQIQKFALRLHSLSPCAYHVLRKTFNTCLPNSRILSTEASTSSYPVPV